MIVVGLDEVGRGAIAGALVVCAAAFDTEWAWRASAKMVPSVPCPVAGVKDSKAYSSRRRREEVSQALNDCETLVGQGYGVVSSSDIDRGGMGWALGVACQRALEQLPIAPDLLLVDGDRPVKTWTGKQLCTPKADALWWPVSAASVLAKVKRDRWLMKLHESFPAYGWNENVGYGTPKHIEAIRLHGITSIHRVRFVQTAVRP